MNIICLYFNKPAKYRETIYRKIESELNADWYFGVSRNGLKLFDPSDFRSVTELQSYEGHGVKWTNGLISLLIKDYKKYLMIGEIRDIAILVFLILKKLFFRNKEVYLWTHGWYGKEKGIEKVFKKFVYSCADGLFLYGNYARECMIKEKFDPEKLFVIHNSLAYNTQLELRKRLSRTNIYSKHFGNNLPVICFIGRLKPVKKLDMIITALHKLKEQGLVYNLIFIGDGECKAELKEQVVHYGLSDYVWFYGECFDEETNAELIYNADLCVAPGNVGLTAIHTLMFGCPVITHNDYRWQMPEFEAIKEGLTGAFFERDNVDSLALVIEKWFGENINKRTDVKNACFNQIDTLWNPDYQINMIKKGMKC